MSIDPARKIAFDIIREVNGKDGYANLVLSKVLNRKKIAARDAAFITELVAGTLRAQGSYDLIISTAANRKLSSLQPAVVDVLRIGTHQLLAMRMPTRAGVSASVELARNTIGERVTGIVNAILRKVAAHDLTHWYQILAEANPDQELAIRTNHPQWIVQVYQDLLGDEAEIALAKNNVATRPTLVVRPGLATVAELVGEPTKYSPFGVVSSGNPGLLPAVRQGRAGVQDEGSQLVAWALAKVTAPAGPWLDMCAGPGGKSALLAGLAAEQNSYLIANEPQPHRAKLVADAIRAYPAGTANVVAGDGRQPAWNEKTFSRVLADVPCTGLGALRRRPESRWRRNPADVTALHELQLSLLRSAIKSVVPGGVVAYVTCSPHRHETVDVVETVLDEYRGIEVLPAKQLLSDIPDCELGDYLQLWPHRHNTDAMFLALLRIDNLRG